jgi:hypothetical protein
MRRKRLRRLPRSEWQVLIPEHHPVFIDWQRYEAKQERIAKNMWPEPHKAGGAVREAAPSCKGSPVAAIAVPACMRRRPRPLYAAPYPSGIHPLSQCRRSRRAADTALVGHGTSPKSRVPEETSLTPRKRCSAARSRTSAFDVIINATANRGERRDVRRDGLAISAGEHAHSLDEPPSPMIHLNRGRSR